MVNEGMKKGDWYKVKLTKRSKLRINITAACTGVVSNLKVQIIPANRHYTLINRGSILTYSQMVSVIVNLVMNIVGIKYFGMYGAALATVVTQGLSLFVSNLVFGKDGREVFIWQIKALNPLSMFRC